MMLNYQEMQINLTGPDEQTDSHVILTNAVEVEVPQAILINAVEVEVWWSY